LCVCKCVWLCGCACMCMCVHVCVRARACDCVYVCMCMCVCVHLRVCADHPLFCPWTLAQSAELSMSGEVPPVGGAGSAPLRRVSWVVHPSGGAFGLLSAPLPWTSPASYQFPPLPPPPGLPPPLQIASGSPGQQDFSLDSRPTGGGRGRLVSQRWLSVEDKLHIPSSPELVGDLSPFRDERPPTDCFECGRRGHFGFECPERFRCVLGVSLPGFRPDGARDPSAWDGNIPGARSRESFLRLIRDHRLLPHPGSPLRADVFERGLPPPLARCSLRGAPGL
jgi:hypothetical protein